MRLWKLLADIIPHTLTPTVKASRNNLYNEYVDYSGDLPIQTIDCSSRGHLKKFESWQLVQIKVFKSRFKKM